MTARCPHARWFGSALLALLGGGCSEDSSSLSNDAFRGDNLLLITFDTTRVDRIGCYGSRTAVTPAWDSLARDGVRVERALSPAPITLPTHTSLLTGLLPIEHGVRDNGIFTVPASVTTLAEAFQARGYDTAAFISAQVLQGSTGLDQGFATYDDELGDVHVPGLVRIERSAFETTDRALSWLTAPRERPWFVWLHYFDPHLPYTPPPVFVQQTGDPYSAEIAFADQQMGRVLQALEREGLAANTLVCATSDHGEGLGDHHEESHGMFVYDTTQHVPLVLRHHALPAGSTLRGQVSLLDLAPTFAEMFELDLSANLAENGTLPGASLLEALLERDAEIWHDVYLEAMIGYYSHGLSPVSAVATRGYKYIEAPRPELYRTELDRKELRNLLDDEAERVTELRARLHELRRGLDPRPPEAGQLLSPQQTAMLARLGYVHLPASAERSLADPKDYAEVEALRVQATTEMQARRYPKAEAMFRRIVDRFPYDATSLGLLGHLLFVQNRHDEAEPFLQRAFALRPDQEGACFDLAKILRARGDDEDAMSLLQEVIRLNPLAPAPVLELAIKIARDLGDEDLAELLEDERRDRFGTDLP